MRDIIINNLRILSRIIIICLSAFYLFGLLWFSFDVGIGLLIVTTAFIISAPVVAIIPRSRVNLNKSNRYVFIISGSIAILAQLGNIFVRYFQGYEMPLITILLSLLAVLILMFVPVRNEGVKNA